MTSSWSAGLTLAKVPPDADGFHSPPIRFRAVVDTSNRFSNQGCLSVGTRLYAGLAARQDARAGWDIRPCAATIRPLIIGSQLKNRRTGILFVS
jgi:hypothetical protein